MRVRVWSCRRWRRRRCGLRLIVRARSRRRGRVTSLRRLVREIADGQRQTIRDVVTFGQESGLSPQDTARQIRQTVGLTQAQGGWVNNFRDRQVAQNIATPGWVWMRL
jgi:hypothetical protein